MLINTVKVSQKITLQAAASPTIISSFNICYL